MKLVKVDDKDLVTEIFASFPLQLPVKLQMKKTQVRETLDPLPEMKQGKSESAEEFRFRTTQAIDAWLKQPLTEQVEETVDDIEVIEGRVIAAWIANGETEQFTSRNLKVVRQRERPEFDARSHTAQLVPIEVTEKWREFEEWEIKPFEPQKLAVAISDECRLRIYQRASATAQMNMTAAKAAGTLDAAGEALYIESLQWVNDMRTAAGGLVAAGDLEYYLDEKWPAPSDEIVAFAAQF